MRQPLLDLQALRSLATGVDLASFAKAADQLGRSTSAISAQLKKLEDQVGERLLQKDGRGLVPTPAGEVLLGYARRLLELNDEAVHAARGARLSGEVRLGVQEDFGERLLPGVLGAFARATGQLIGAVVCEREARHKVRHQASLQGMVVTPPARAQGVGRALLAAFDQHARQLPGLEQVILSVTASNAAAVRLCEAACFRRYGLLANALKIGDTYHDKALMVKIL